MLRRQVKNRRDKHDKYLFMAREIHSAAASLPMPLARVTSAEQMLGVENTRLPSTM
jgi:hypothetical protein